MLNFGLNDLPQRAASPLAHQNGCAKRCRFFVPEGRRDESPHGGGAARHGPSPAVRRSPRPSLRAGIDCLEVRFVPGDRGHGGRSSETFSAARLFIVATNISKPQMLSDGVEDAAFVRFELRLVDTLGRERVARVTVGDEVAGALDEAIGDECAEESRLAGSWRTAFTAMMWSPDASSTQLRWATETAASCMRMGS